ncbi:unnamed protein product [Somion occarium]|uniref:Uncharacterized protein n=1 Tax=Somion occarium TaxID=3059160 RepID=A0ABP1CYE6_9APHY
MDAITYFLDILTIYICFRCYHTDIPFSSILALLLLPVVHTSHRTIIVSPLFLCRKKFNSVEREKKGNSKAPYTTRVLS